MWTPDSSIIVTKQDQKNAEKEEAKGLFIIERNQRLADTDWVVLRNLETNEPVPEAWLTYRQALRDLPNVTSDYSNVEWPVRPE